MAAIAERGDMTIQDRLLDDLQLAMRQGQAERREALRMLRAEIQREEIEIQRIEAERLLARAGPTGQEAVEHVERRSLTDVEVTAVLRRMVKRHEDAIEQFRRGNRTDLVAHEEAQLAVAREYLSDLAPHMSRAEIEALARGAITSSGARGRGDMGKVMRVLAGQLKDRADMREVNRIVQELLAS